MKRRRFNTSALPIGRWLLCFCLCMPAIALPATPGMLLDELSVPADATLQIVSYNAVHNGVPQALATLHTANSIDSVFDYYRQLWATESHGDVPGYVEAQLPQWRLISRLHQGFNIVVQLNEDQTQSGTRGFVSVRALDLPMDLREQAPFSQFELLSSNRSQDGADTSSVRVYASALSVGRTRDLFRQRLVRQGWRLLSDMPAGHDHSMVLTQAHSRLELMFMPSREYASVLVVNEVMSQ